MLTPAEGFWHSDPTSHVIQRCVALAACTSRGPRLINEQLRALDEAEAAGHGVTSILQLQVAGLFDGNAYRGQECAEGFEGILCGVCAPGCAKD